MSKIKCIMEVGELYGGVRFLKEIPNPGKSSRRYCEVECNHCGTKVGRILSHVHSGVIESCGCKFKPKGPPATIFSGDKFVTNQGYTVEVIEYLSEQEIYIKFEGKDFTLKTNATGLKRGGVENPYHKSIKGVAYLGELSNKAPKYNVIRNRWMHMLRRVYSEDLNFSSYADCKICEEWHNFSVFYEWVMGETGGKLKGLDLDKDVLSINGKIYSPSTCAFIPTSLNKRLTRLEVKSGGWYDAFGKRWRTVEKCLETNKDVYIKHTDKEAADKYYVEMKASRILRLAEDFKDQISEIVYQGMKNKAETLLSL